MRILKPSRDKVINHTPFTSYNYVSSVIYLVPLINIDISKAIDHITFLHMESTMHWHTHYNKIEVTAGH